MEKIAILLTSAPYGDTHASEAMRHAMGAVAADLKVALVLSGDGVLLALKAQETGRSGFTNLGNTLDDCMDRGIDVYAKKDTLQRLELNISELREGIQEVTGKDASALFASADQLLIF